jgi:AcrR family transcriptional regulator
METSARSAREARRHETSLRISHCARLLADEHGIDGFTMDDLAAAAEVSRRTLFNYFPGKDAAVRGDRPPLPPDLIATFREGGPTGDLIDDLVALADALLDDADIDRDELALIRRVMHDNPRLITLAKQDFDASGEEIRAAVEAREGAEYDDTRTRVVLRVFGALFDLALDDYLEHPDRELAEVFDQAVAALRSALA